VVATRFPHAVELLGDGAGVLVEHQNPQMLAEAIRHVLTRPGFAAELATRRGRMVAELGWPAVAVRYAELAGQLVRRTSVASEPGAGGMVPTA
jgi:glycosyltransferase involved in cell wall biosynthesis